MADSLSAAGLPTVMLHLTKTAVQLHKHDRASASCWPVPRRCDVVLMHDVHETKGETPELLLDVKLSHVFLFTLEALRFKLSLLLLVMKRSSACARHSPTRRASMARASAGSKPSIA